MFPSSQLVQTSEADPVRQSCHIDVVAGLAPVGERRQLVGAEFLLGKENSP